MILTVAQVAVWEFPTIRGLNMDPGLFYYKDTEETDRQFAETAI